MNGLSKITKKNLERIEDKTGHEEHKVEEERKLGVERVDQMYQEWMKWKERLKKEDGRK